MDGGDTDVFDSGLYKRYAARPLGDLFDNMSLAHFAVWYATSKAPSTFGTSSRAQPRYELQVDGYTCVESKHVFVYQH